MEHKSTEQIEADYQTQQKLRIEAEKKTRLLSEEKELIHLNAEVNLQYEQVLSNYRAEKAFYTEMLDFLKSVNTRDMERAKINSEVLQLIKQKLTEL
jgi:hypothetical protein